MTGIRFGGEHQSKGFAIVRAIERLLASISFIPVSNMAWVNTDLTDNNPTSRIFKSVDDAYTWIVDNGSLSATNIWQIVLPSGYVAEVTIYRYIKYLGSDGTTIGTLKSDVTLIGYTDLFDSYISTVIINNLEIAEGKCAAIFNSMIFGFTEPSGIAYMYLSDVGFINMGTTNLDLRNINFTTGIDTNVSFIGCNNISGSFSNSAFNNCTYIRLEADNCRKIILQQEIGDQIIIKNSTVSVKDIEVLSGGILEIRNCNLNIANLTCDAGGQIKVFNNSYEDIGTIVNNGSIIGDNIPNNSAYHPASNATGYIRYNDIIYNSAEGDTLEISDTTPTVETYTFTATPVNPTDVEIGTDVEETLQNLYNSITANSSLVTCTIDADTISLTAVVAGLAGNNIAITSSSTIYYVSPNLTDGYDAYYQINPLRGKITHVDLNDDTKVIIVTGNEYWQDNPIYIIVNQIAGNKTVLMTTYPSGNILTEGGATYTPTQTAGAVDVLELMCDGKGNVMITKITPDLK